MTINKKIIQFLEYKGISQRKFTSDANLSEGILRLGSNIGADKLNMVNKILPDLNMNWLLFDKGNMALDEENIKNQFVNNKELETENIHLHELLKSKNETISILKHQLNIDNNIKDVDCD